MHTNQTRPQLVKPFTLFFLLFLLYILLSCKKSQVEEPSPEKPSSENVSSSGGSSSGGCDVTVCEDCSFQETIANDTAQYATVLGAIYSNPYSIANMTLAY